MNKDKGKATWDVSSTRIFIEECIQQIYKKQRQGTSFTKSGWNNILSAFNERTGKSYDKKQLKNRLDNLRKEWRTWETLFSKETGIGFDPIRNMVIADDEWWERKKQENPLYEKFRYNGMMFINQLQIIFKDVIASGEDMLAPSSTQPQGNDEDVYRPTIDLEEGSGDSEEELLGANTRDSVGVTDELKGINLRTNTTPSGATGSGSHGKRKRGEGSSRTTKKKIPSSKKIADAVSAIAAASQDRAEAYKKVCNTDVSVSKVITELLSIEDIANDPDFCRRCCNLMMHKICREMFVGLKGHREILIQWLRDHAYNTPEFQKPPHH